jgi:glycine/D-amino acid oxidase-like deaminating enzyme
VTKPADVVVIGGGIIGCSAAAELAARGVRVTLVEATGIGAGASGRNLGALQHPFDPVLLPLHADTLRIYRDLSADADGFTLPHQPAGLLLLQRDTDAARRQADRMRADFPELSPRFLDPDAVSTSEPSLTRGPAGVLLATGYPVPPAAATRAMAMRARQRGASLLIGSGAHPVIQDGLVAGVAIDDGRHVPADVVLVTAGPWSPPLVDPGGAWQPIHRTWGVTVQLRLGDATPRHVVEEDEVDVINRSAAATSRAATATEAEEPPTLFSIAAADGVSTLGSTFLPAEPEPSMMVAVLIRRGAMFLPAIAGARILATRICARPQSVDGRPFIGAVGGVDGLWVCAGHGPWGMSTGPASAALAVRAMLDPTTSIPSALGASRRAH